MIKKGLFIVLISIKTTRFYCDCENVEISRTTLWGTQWISKSVTFRVKYWIPQDSYVFFLLLLSRGIQHALLYMYVYNCSCICVPIFYSIQCSTYMIPIRKILCSPSPEPNEFLYLLYPDSKILNCNYIFTFSNLNPDC